VNRLKVQRLESGRKIRDIYKVVECLISLLAVCLDISSAEAQIGQVHAIFLVCKTTADLAYNRIISDDVPWMA